VTDSELRDHRELPVDLEWVATIDPDRKWEASIRFGVEHPKEALVVGGRSASRTAARRRPG